MHGKAEILNCDDDSIHERLIEAGQIDPYSVISHRIPLEQAPDAYEKFHKKTDDYIKVVLKKPGMDRAATIPNQEFDDRHQ